MVEDALALQVIDRGVLERNLGISFGRVDQIDSGRVDPVEGEAVGSKAQRLRETSIPMIFERRCRGEADQIVARAAAVVEQDLAIVVAP